MVLCSVCPQLIRGSDCTWWRLEQFILAFATLEQFSHLISLSDFSVCVFLCMYVCVCVFLICRLFDHSMEGFKNWEFMTTHCWGEKAAGDWVLEIYDSPSQLRSQKVPGTRRWFSNNFEFLKSF